MFRGIGDIFGGLVRLVRGSQPGGVSNVTGPIGIAQVVGEVVQQATIPVWVVVLNLTAFISINLGILNLLPIPALDGGRLALRRSSSGCGAASASRRSAREWSI